MQVAEECRHLLKLRASNRGIAIHDMFEPDMPRLWADERAVRQICLNLLSNAIKFTPQGGEVWLKVGWTAAGGQYFSVRDNGPGIPESEIPIVLDTFGQGSNAIKSAEQGAGLGLPIVKSLIELHGGTFSLKSKLREGTEVVVTFPPERVMTALEPVVEAPPPLDLRSAAARPVAGRAAPCSIGGLLASMKFGRAGRIRARHEGPASEMTAAGVDRSGLRCGAPRRANPSHIAARVRYNERGAAAREVAVRADRSSSTSAIAGLACRVGARDRRFRPYRPEKDRNARVAHHSHSVRHHRRLLLLLLHQNVGGGSR